MLVAEIRADAIVRGDLWVGAGAARPAVLRIDLVAVEITIRVIERAAISFERLCAKNRVVHDAFHAVAITRITIDAEQVASELEVGVGPTRSFEAVMRVRKACEDIIAIRSAKKFIGSPPAGCEALCQQKCEGIGRGAKMLFTAKGKVGLHGGAQRIHVAVSMAAGKVAAIFGKWIVVNVVEIVFGERFVTVSRAALIGKEEVFGDGVGLVPSPGIVKVALTPLDIVLNRFAGKVFRGDVRCVVEDRECVGIGGVPVRVNEAADKFVVSIGGETAFFVEIARNCFCVELVQAKNFFAHSLGAVDSIAARESGNPLAKSSRRRESFPVFLPVIKIGIVVVPAT